MKYFISLILLIPVFASAQTPSDFREFVGLLLRIIQNTITILIGAIALGTLYGVMLYMMNSDNEKKREELKGYLIYAVVGLSVVMSMWGLIAILTSTLGWGLVIPQITAPA